MSEKKFDDFNVTFMVMFQILSSKVDEYLKGKKIDNQLAEDILSNFKKNIQELEKKILDYLEFKKRSSS